LFLLSKLKWSILPLIFCSGIISINCKELVCDCALQLEAKQNKMAASKIIFELFIYKNDFKIRPITAAIKII
jgi:hypothetical protein